MILTVTLNTALDITYRIPSLRTGVTHRVSDVAERPGGKGVNVARVLAALGHEVTVTGFAGGTTGRVLRDRLTDVPQLTDALVRVSGTTRRTVVVVDERSGTTTRFNEPGPDITHAQWSAFQEVYEDLLGSASAVALCGSLPPGVPVGAYAHLIRTARAAGVPALLDTSGAALRRGVAGRPDILKPNAGELAELTGSHEPLRATQDARRRGARAVVASLGPQGLLAATPDARWHAAPPARLRGNPVGAGDSAVAGILSALVEQQPWPARLSRAVALSAATVLSPAAGEFDRTAYEEFLPGVTVARNANAA